MKKRLFALLLVFALVFTMGITVFAAGSASITINNATAGNTYRLYKVFDATFSGPEDNASVAYTYTKGKNTALDAEMFGTSSAFDLKETKVANVYNVYKKSSKSEYDVSQFVKKACEYCTAVETVTATSSTVKFTNLDQGYYIILSDVSGETVITGLVTVNTNVTIEAKEKVPTPRKVIVTPTGEETEFSANFGDTITYKLMFEGTVNSYDGKKITEYKAIDKLGEGMTNFQIVSVKVGSKTLTSAEYTYTAQKGDNPATIVIPWVTSDSAKTFLYNEGDVICIECTAVVGTNASIGPTSGADESKNTNKGSFGWKYDDGSSYEPHNFVSTSINVYSLSVYKSDGQGKPLAGAKFKLFDKDGNEISIVKLNDGEYRRAIDTDKAADKLKEAVTPASGKLTIIGLEESTYIMRETASPSGYNLLEEDQQFLASDFAPNSSSEEIIYLDKDGNITTAPGYTTLKITYTYSTLSKNIVNNKGTTLPKTGGIGTTIFYIIGGVIVAGAIVFFVTKRRMDSKNKA